MAVWDRAKKRLLPENASQPKIEPNKVILHSAVNNTNSLYGFFGSDGVVVESHFYVDQNGNTEQYIDTNIQADANYKANPKAISIETWDGGDPDRNPWNPDQLYALSELIKWCVKTHAIPPYAVTSPTGAGIGYHSQYQGIWTPNRKTCPGLARIGQVSGIIANVGGIAPLPVLTVPTDNPAPPKIPTDLAPPFPLAQGKYFGYRDDPNGISGYYSNSSDLKKWQARMATRGWRIDVDGKYGDQTHDIVRRFQADKSLSIDGKIGPVTWRSAWEAQIT